MFELIPCVDLIIESIDNGNITGALKTIEKLSKKQIMAVTAYVVERSPDRVRNTFLTAVERQL